VQNKLLWISELRQGPAPAEFEEQYYAIPNVNKLEIYQANIFSTSML
jgi:hypothetical protein